MDEGPPHCEQGYRCAPVLLLVVVALVQIARVHTEGLTPWKGGGFGMFATNDSASGRVLRLYLLRTVGSDLVRSALVELPMHEQDLRRQIRELRAVPTQDRMHDLLARLAAEDFALYPNDPAALPISTAAPRYRVLAKGAPGADPRSAVQLPYDKLRLELWRMRFDSDGPTLRTELRHSLVAQRRSTQALGQR